MSSVPLIEGELKQSLLQLAIDASPLEAVGIIHEGIAYSLRNCSPSPHDSFEVTRGELRDLVAAIGIPLEDMLDEVFFWHTHPRGGVGPSRFDMENRTPLKHHLVVALVDDDLVPTWY